MGFRAGLVIVLALPLSAYAETICPVGCDFVNVHDAVASVPVGGAGVFALSAGIYLEAGTIFVDENRSVTLTSVGAVTLSNGLDGPALRVEGLNARLTVIGMSVTAQSDRALVVGPDGYAQIDDSVLYTIGLQEDGGAARIEGGTLVATDTLFLDNVVTGAGGHLIAISAQLDLTDCEFTGGFARRGGAVLLQGSTGLPTVATLTGGRFDDNLASELAGAIAVSGAVELDLVGVTFEGNAAESGGVIADYGGPSGEPDVTITGCTFEGNRADGEGGAIAVGAGAWTVTSSRFSDNEALTGGAVRVAGGTITLDQNLLCRNVATTGGAVSTHTPAEQMWRNNRMIENIAVGAGGAIDHAGGLLSLRQHNLLGNTASIGGAVRSQNELSLRNSLVGWTDGAVAVVGVTVDADWNAYWANVAGDVVGNDGVEGAVTHDIVGDPRLERYQVGTGCDAVDSFYSWYGALRDSGDPFAQLDRDGSPADVGAFGGPIAPVVPWTDDIDLDGYPPLYDCIEGDGAVHPEAEDLPYDGLDANCDRSNDYDADADGYEVSVDCDDADPAVNPEARDRVGFPDQNCDGLVDVDRDTYPATNDCDDTDPEVHPGAVEDLDPLVDADCVPPADIVRPLDPRTCATVAAPPGWGWLAVGAGCAVLRRRSRGLPRRRPRT